MAKDIRTETTREPRRPLKRRKRDGTAPAVTGPEVAWASNEAPAPPTDDERYRVAQFAARYSFPLDPFQLEAMGYLAAGASILVTAPTGTGKTVIAEFALQDALTAHGRVIYTTPLRALSAQKLRDFAAIWGAENVGMVTGETAINDRAPILVMTTEILRNRLVSDSGSTLGDLRAVVLDEFHYLADLDRGRVWEEVVLLLPRSVQLVCLSATIPNWQEVAGWLREVHGPTATIVHDERAVPLDVWYADGGKVTRVADLAGGPIVRPKRPTSRFDRRGEWEDRAVEIIGDLAERRFLPAIVFVMSRRRTEEWAQAALASGLELVASAAVRDQIDRELQSVFDRIGSEELAVAQLELLALCLPRGLAFHHAGLVPTLRELVERLFEAGLVSVVFATGTLALGVNMPARTVVLEQLSTRDDNGWRPLAKREFLQMAGRAGRRGKDTFGHIVVLKHPFDQFESLERILSLPPEPVSSAFQLDYASALYLLGNYGPGGMAEIYRRSFAVYRKLRSVEFVAAANPDAADRAPAFVARRRAQIASESTRDARRLESVLGLFGYWDGERITDRAAFLRRFFHGNALLTSELVIEKALSGCEPAELAEMASWLEGGGRTGRGRRPSTLPTNLQQRHRAIVALHRRIERVEEENGLNVSAGLGPTANHGLVFRAAKGESLSTLCEHYALDPGDVYGRLTETEMWLRQLEGALTASGFDPDLALTSKRARVILRLRAGSVGFTPVIGSIDDDLDDDADDDPAPI